MDNSNYYKTSTGLAIRKFDGFDISDVKFEWKGKSSQDIQKFIRDHNRIFEQILGKKENIQLEQKVMDSYIQVLEKSKNCENYKDIVAALKEFRAAFAEKIKHLINYIDDLEK